MRVQRPGPLILSSMAILGLGLVLLRWWQGPQVQGYHIASMPLVQTVVATGRVVTVARAQIGSEITGVVLERRVQEGDAVQPGDILLVLRADELTAQVREAEAALAQLTTTTRPQAEVALQRAVADLQQARRETQRRRDLAQRGLLATEDLEQAEQQETLARMAADSARLSAAALAPGASEETLLRERLQRLQAQLARAVVRAEVAGTVLTRNVEPGDLVQPGRVLFTVALSGNTEIRVPFDEKNLSLLALQQPAQIIADAYPDTPFPARITFIAPSIDPQLGSVEVRLTVDPVPDFLRQDMTVSVNVETGRRAQAVAVPNDALADVRDGSARVLAVRDGKVEQRTVRLGLRGLAMSEVTEGLAAGDRVLLDASGPWAPGTRVRFREQTLSRDPNSAGSASRNELPVSLD